MFSSQPEGKKDPAHETVNYRQDAMLRESHDSEIHAGEVANPDVWLQALGYAPELVRNRSTFQVAFMSFVLASIPYSLATTLFYPLNGGGSTCVIWGWLAVSCITMCVAASLGEITSVFPTAGVSNCMDLHQISTLISFRVSTTRASCSLQSGVVGSTPGFAAGTP